MTLTPGQIRAIRDSAEAAKKQMRGFFILPETAQELFEELDRLRAVIRETCDPRSCGGGMHSHTCKLYEIEP